MSVEHSHLSARNSKKLAELRTDYEAVVGQPFENFYCPILFRDEDVGLCAAHIVNQVFRDSPRNWTLQRSDVDSFYGSMFEAEFVSLQERDLDHPAEALSDHRLDRALRPFITVGDEKVEHYRPAGRVPPQHTRVLLKAPGGEIEMALKMREEELSEQTEAKWQIQIDKDIRVAALASLLKAAHLTVFSMLGYRYALSSGGRFLGGTVLGDFFSAHRGAGRKKVLKASRAHFSEFANMMRPLVFGAKHLQGTISDGRLQLVGTEKPWGIIVVVRTGQDRHAVLVPVLEDQDASAHFLNFLSTPSCYLAIRDAEWRGDHFAVAPQTHRVYWPAADLLPST